MFQSAMIWLALAAAPPESDKPQEKPRAVRIEPAFLRLIDQVDVPAQGAGALAKIPVREGQLVHEDDILVQMDDADAALALERARFDLEIAKRVAANPGRLEEARTAVLLAEAARDKARLELEMARAKADSDISVRYHKKALATAEGELHRAIAARKEFRDSVSLNEFEHLQLAHEKSKLDLEQAEHDRQQAGLARQVKQAEAGGLDLAVRQKEIALKQVEEDLQLAAITQRIRENDLAVAQRELERRRIKASLSGVVVQIHRRKGEWVEPGEKVLRILRLDRLRAEGFVSARDAQRDLHGATAAITVTLPNKSQVEVKGKVVFVSPEIDPVNGQILVWAEVDNPAPQFVLRPGMRGAMTIQATPEH